MAKKNAKKQALVPKLRFPGFRDDWDYGPLSTILREHKRKNGDGCVVFSVSLEKGLVNQIDHMGRSFSAKDTSNYNRVRPLDIVYTKSPLRDYPYGIVKQSRIETDVAVSPLYGVFSPRIGHLGTLVEAYFDSPYRSKHFIGPLAQKGAKNTINITNSGFLSGKMAVPSSNGEQRKIAECLDSLNDLIAASIDKLEALQDHKKGLLQQLFPAEGKTAPKLRLPGFRGKWKSNNLENLCKAKICYGIVQAGPHVPNGMPYIKSTDLNSKLRLCDLSRTSEVIAKKYRRSEVMPGDIVFSLRGNIGVSQIVPEDIPIANLTQGTARIRTKGPSQFVFQAIQSQSVHDRIMAVSKGSTFQEISLEDLRKVRLSHPEEAEQQAIAECLYCLDALITNQTEKISALKEHKKGLMQQLLPNPELEKA